MFTGLIQGKGRIHALDRRGAESRLEVQPLFELRDMALGESIAVDGVCLTVEAWNVSVGGRFTVYASAETMSLTTLGRLRRGAEVNLERALALGDRLGGHLVSGHVDCLAVVERVTPAGESTIYRLSFPRRFAPQIVAKGSVALDGVSLTVNNCGLDFLEVNIIPATQRETTISSWAPGLQVNLETDILGKYVERMLLAREVGQEHASGGSGLSEEMLRGYGF